MARQSGAGRAVEFDVVVVGAGNAGLCAALSAREAGARVAVLEKAPRETRGGDTAFTGGLYRFPFDNTDQIAKLLPEYARDEMARVEIDPYPKRALLDDMDRMTEGLADPALTDTLADEAYPTMRWLTERGVKWVLAYGRQAYKAGDKHRFFGNLILEATGGGQGLADQLVATAERSGVTVLYETKATGLVLDDRGAVTAVEARGPDGGRRLTCHAAVFACGGFQANSEMRARYLGPEWELAKVRGTRFNTGDGIRIALDVGAQPFGHWSSCHAVAWDLMAPPFGDLRIGDLYQKHSYPIGIVVNRDGRRFLDEGADFRNYTYAKYGREILRQPGRAAFQIFDQKTISLLRDDYRVREVTKARADTLEELADELLIDRAGFMATVRAYNDAVNDNAFEPARLDGKASRPDGQPPKSNWAQRIDQPPFEGYAVTCGITFTFGGVRIDPRAQVLDTEDRPIPGLFAAGEMVGGIFYYNYPGGTGLTTGSVFGRRAGLSAARMALNGD